MLQVRASWAFFQRLWRVCIAAVGGTCVCARINTYIYIYVCLSVGERGKAPADLVHAIASAWS